MTEFNMISVTYYLIGSIMYMGIILLLILSDFMQTKPVYDFNEKVLFGHFYGPYSMTDAAL